MSPDKFEVLSWKQPSRMELKLRRHASHMNGLVSMRVNCGESCTRRFTTAICPNDRVQKDVPLSPQLKTAFAPHLQ